MSDSAKRDAKWFYDFFRKIPASKWTTGTLGNSKDIEGPHCALGHLGCTGYTSNKLSDEARELASLFPTPECGSKIDMIWHINDGRYGWYSLGRTPRSRILNKLKQLIAKGK